MVALPLFDSVMSSDRTRERSPEIAAQLIQSTVAELKQIEELDDIVAPKDPLYFDRPMAALLRGMYENWAQQAESLLERLRQVEKIFGPLPNSEVLRDAHGRTRARLSISLDDAEQGLRDIAEGRLHSLEEVRRELRLRVR